MDGMKEARVSIIRPCIPNFKPNMRVGFCKIFASSKRPDISKKIPNLENRTIPKLAKMKSSENSV